METPMLLLLLAAAMAAGGVFAIFIARRLKAKEAEASAWPTAPGELIEVELTKHVGAALQYTVKMTYRFSVGRREYTGTRMRIGGNFVGREELSRAEQIYRVGGPVTVHYDPVDPSNSVLKTDWSSFGPMLLGIVLIGFGALVGLLALTTD